MARKIWHFAGVMLIFVIYNKVPDLTGIQLMMFFTALAIIIDLLRKQLQVFNEVVVKVFGPVMREHEKEGIAGTTYLLSGVFLLILFFPRHVTNLSILFLATADPLAGYFGVRYGKDRIMGNKTLQGTLAAFFTCAIIMALYCISMGLMKERLLIVSLLAGLIGAISELLPLFKLDDNLIFPLLSGGLLWGLFTLFAGL